jgi:hypothetical protein
MLSRAAFVRTDVSEEHRVSIIGVTGIGELGTTLAVTSDRRMLRSFQLTDSYHPDDGGATFLRNVGSYLIHTVNIPEDEILHCHRSENFKY